MHGRLTKKCQRVNNLFFHHGDHALPIYVHAGIRNNLEISWYALKSGVSKPSYNNQKNPSR